LDIVYCNTGIQYQYCSRKNARVIGRVIVAGTLQRAGAAAAAAVATACLGAADAFTPYTPAVGWTYALEAARDQAWPGCTDRLVSLDSDSRTLSLAGSVQVFTLVAGSKRARSDVVGGGDGAVYLQLANGHFMSYAGPCDQLHVDTWPEAGINQEFKFVRPANNTSAPFEWSLVGVGRAGCPGADTVTFSAADCGAASLAMGDGARQPAADATFRLHAVRGGEGYDKKANSNGPCADPFAWCVAGINVVVEAI
jgi:hypothetical protein